MIGIALIGKHKNPILTHFFNRDLITSNTTEQQEQNLIQEDNEVEFKRYNLELILYSAIDVIEEKTNLIINNTETVSNENAFFGLLGYFDEYALYGLISNTKIVAILILHADIEPTPNSSDIKGFLYELQMIYINYSSNPFTSIANYTESFPVKFANLKFKQEIEDNINKNFIDFNIGAPEEGAISDADPKGDEYFIKQVNSLALKYRIKFGGFHH